MISYRYKKAQLLFVGINPHFGSFDRGVPFSNNKLFWYLLSEAGILKEKREQLRDDAQLKKIYRANFTAERGLGFVNLIDRPTRDITTLEKNEEAVGQKRLTRIIGTEQPKVICFIGKVAYEKYFGNKNFNFGWQKPIQNSKVFVMHFPLRGEAIVRVREFKKVLRAAKLEKPTIFTIGHSTHPIEEFIGLLKTNGIQEIVDVRTVPRSRHNPQYEQDSLKASLKKAGIRYRHIKELGGLRHSKKDSTNLGWRNKSFRGYADYMSTPEFADGLEKLIGIASLKKTAIMCAEAVPWRCHRSLIGDALVKKDWRVLDIISKTSVSPHKLTPFLKMRKGKITYPAIKPA